jgi:DNA-binding MarR family transcriptional regulator
VNDSATDPTVPTSAELEFAQSLGRAVGRIHRRFRSERADGELGDAAVTVLGVLQRNGRMSLSELSEHERVTPGSMSQTVNRLTSAGYAARTSDPGDKRRVLFEISERGAELAAEVRASRYTWLASRLNERTQAERDALEIARRVLQEIADS